ncbi:hypothetical protein [Haloechinothrix sp. LS1_15]|uniref:hypothetical protein n=1 Tax=Haloechinothrix sp. LS1_15 TaxID=2652248 RepID=UPI0029467BAE|nr:hypothetical protein [Haloechinothrix sp. LS1_15]MDV6014585.1 hypothetical protein [Haloechinothrix sp. LS1_15]
MMKPMIGVEILDLSRANACRRGIDLSGVGTTAVLAERRDRIGMRGAPEAGLGEAAKRRIPGDTGVVDVPLLIEERCP